MRAPGACGGGPIVVRVATSRVISLAGEHDWDLRIQSSTIRQRRIKCRQRFPIPFVTPVNIVYIRKPTYSDFEMKYLGGFCDLVAVDVGDTRIIERGVEHLVTSSESIRYLFLWGTEVGDSVIKPLSQLKSLEMLNISARNISYNGFLAIKHVLPNCYLSHESFGTHFQDESGHDATRAWIQNGEQNRAPKHSVELY